MDVTDEVGTPVSRPFGVTASAIVVIIGSLFVIMAGLMIATVPATPPPGTSPAPPISESAFRTFVIGASIFLAALGVFGIWTATGLFKLRPWARTSIMVFAGIMTVISAISIVAVAMVPFSIPEGKGAVDMRFMRPVLISVYAIPTIIGAWWLVQFNRPATKAAFSSGALVGEPERPLSISIIAWMFLIGGPGSLIPIFAKMPLFLAGFVLTGVQAQLGYFVYGALSLYLGWGLLKLDEFARKLSIAYFVVTGVHMILVTAIPAWATKMTSMQDSFSSSAHDASPMAPGQMMVFTLIFAVLFCGGGIWFLTRNKRAFRLENPSND